MTDILGISARIGTPLALAGLALLVLLLVFRTVLRMPVFANIGGEHTADILKRVLRYVFWLALVTVVIGLVMSVLPNVLSSAIKEGIGPRDSDLELVDIGLIRDSVAAVTHRFGRDVGGSFFPARVLDVKLRNRGRVDAFVKQLELRVIDTAIIEQCRDYMTFPVSARYDADLDSLAPLHVSHNVPAGGLERLQFSLAASKLPEGYDKYYRLRLRVLSDGDSKILESRDFAVRMFATRVWSDTSPSSPACLARRPRREQEDYARVKSWPISYSMPRHYPFE